MFSVPKGGRARVQQLRNMAKNRNRPMNIDDIEAMMGMHHMGGNPWQFPDINTARDFGPDLFEDMHAFSPPRSMSTSDSRNRRSNSRNSFRGSGNGTDGIPFEKAAASLAKELDETAKYCDFVDNEFHQDMLRVRQWAPPNVIFRLWELRIDWNGVKAEELAKHPGVKPADGVRTYTTHCYRLMEAVNTMMMAGPPPMRILEDPECKVSPMEVKTAVKKLGVVLNGIEELFQVVRQGRHNMRPFVKQLHDALAILNDIDVVWMGPRKQRDHEYYEHQPRNFDFAPRAPDGQPRRHVSTPGPREYTPSSRDYRQGDFEGRSMASGNRPRNPEYHPVIAEEVEDEEDGDRSHFTNWPRN